MVQFYFLSILVNFIGGLTLSGDIFAKKCSFVASLQEFFKTSTHQLIFAITATVTGVFKIISVFNDDVLIIGDILPAIASLFIAIHFFSAYFTEKTGKVEEHLDKVNNYLEGYKSILGIACIVIAMLHFFFPGVIFL